MKKTPADPALVASLVAAAESGADWRVAMVEAERALMSKLVLEVDGPAPEPFYQRGRVKLWCGDARKIAPRLRRPVRSVSWADPPYSARTHANVTTNARPLVGNIDISSDGCAANKVRNVDLGFGHLPPELRRFLAAMARRIATRYVGHFCDAEGLDAWDICHEAAGLRSLNPVYWRKLGGAPQLNGQGPARSRETVALAHVREKGRGAPWWNRGGHQAEYEIDAPLVYDVPIALNRGGRDERKHTTKKPIDLMSRIVADFADHRGAWTDDAEVWIDMTSGEGTTLEAAALAGLGAWGIELDPKWAQAAADRIDRALDRPRPGNLFEPKRREKQGDLFKETT